MIAGFPLVGNAQVQTNSGISGIVTDTTGALIPEASVTVREQTTGATYNTKANAGGAYSFPSLLPGVYTITVSHPGFETAVVTDRAILAAQPAHVDVSLHVGSVSTSVTVSAAGAELTTTTATQVSTLVPPTLVNTLPLNGLDYFAYAELTPGAVPQNASSRMMSFAGYQFVQAANTFVMNGIMLGGARDSASNVSVDGVNTQSHHYEQSTALQSPYDIEELEVQTGTMNAEFGNGVTSTNVITKKGTNSYHGSLYEYLRVNNLDATPFFTNLEGLQNPHYDQNQFGGAVGGPIKKDKLFFFANYEGYRLVQDANDYEEVPDASLREGNFAGWSLTAGGPPETIYNPYSFNATTGLRNSFPNNQIPLGPTTLCSPQPTCVDPVALKYLQNWVTSANGTFNGLPYLLGTATTVMNRDQGTGRIDWAKSESSTIYGRYSNYQSDKEFAGGAQPLEGTGNPYSSQNMVIHWTKSISSNLVNDLMLGYSRPIWILGANPNSPDVSAQVGVLNVRPGPGGPSFSGTEFNLDNTYAFWFTATENKIQLKDDLNWSKGRHNLKFGFEGINSRFIYPTLSDSKGVFALGIYWSALCPVSAACTANAPGGKNAGGDAFADYLLGAVADNTTFENTPDEYVGHQQYIGGYVQDSWRATRKLTINAGLRYELWTPWLVPNNTTVSFNFQTGNVVYALQNPDAYLSSQYCYGECAPLTSGVPRQGYTLGEKNFAPRLGLAFMLTPTTVIRAGFGVYFDANANNNQFSNIQTGAQPFFLEDFENPDLSQETPSSIYLTQNLFPASGPTSILVPNASPAPESFKFVMPHFPIPAVDEWSFSVQKQLGAYWGTEVSYLGSHTVHEPQYVDNNAPELPQGAAAALSQQQRRLFTQWGSMFSWIPIGYAKYNALMADIKNRPWHGLSFLGSWTWAKNLASSYVEGSDAGDSNFRFPYIHTGPSQLTPAQSFRAGYAYKLPTGPGQRFGNTANPFLGKLAGGWSVSGITTFESGTPFYVSAPDESNTAEYSAAEYANLLQGCKPNNGPRTRFEWFNTSCFALPAAGTVGNSTQGSFTDPGINNWDISIIKDTKTGFPRDSGSMQIRADFYDAWNHTEFAGPTISITSSTYGQITSTRPARIVQFVLEYRF